MPGELVGRCLFHYNLICTNLSPHGLICIRIEKLVQDADESRFDWLQSSIYVLYILLRSEWLHDKHIQLDFSVVLFRFNRLIDCTQELHLNSQ